MIYNKIGLSSIFRIKESKIISILDKTYNNKIKIHLPSQQLGN